MSWQEQLEADWQEQLEADGFCLLPQAVSASTVAAAIAHWQALLQSPRVHASLVMSAAGSVSGARNILDLWPEVVELLRVPAVGRAISLVLGPTACVVRGLYFDKPPGHSWALPWHKDYTLAVQAHRPSAIVTKPTTKAGVPHVVAPADILERMLTVRIHLDPMTAENGPLRVIPGSHRNYHLADDPPRQPQTILCQAGDVLLMRPLVTHASGHTVNGTILHRRIVHFECAAAFPLPDGITWKWAIPLTPQPVREWGGEHSIVGASQLAVGASQLDGGASCHPVAAAPMSHDSREE
ncbi:MAG: phytanoyl-CoA dioxygenase family protein [Gemmataceae bacterium]|nr:phytanoyl-CoA dioxygenase family protein [Gemmata sp.]MDW8197500.1 phytanoyl-CoA dioxygenase family protein [Gemmataceae bacterium]